MLSWFRGKSFEEQVSEFDDKINIVINSLVKSSKSTGKDELMDLTNLQNLDTCNEYVIFLGAELEKRFKKVDAEAIADAIYIGKRRKNSQKKELNNLDADNYEGTNAVKHTKKELCMKISSHYVRILNLLSAILTAINPDLNMCSRRIKALYETTSSDINTGFVRTCKSDDMDLTNPLYTDNIKNIPGIKQLLNLYYFNLIQDADNMEPEELDKIKKEFENIITTFTEAFKFTLEENPIEPVDVSQIQESIEELNKTVATSPPITNPVLQDKINEMSNSLQTLKTAIAPNTVQQLKNNISSVKNEFEELKLQLSTLINEIKQHTTTHEVPMMNTTTPAVPMMNTTTPEVPAMNTTTPAVPMMNTTTPEVPATPMIEPSVTVPQSGGVYDNTTSTTQPVTTDNKLLQNIVTPQPEIMTTNNSINVSQPETETTAADIKLAKTQIGKFLEFVDKYKTYYEIPEEYKLTFETNKIDDYVDFYTCSTKPSQVVINIEDSKYSEFKKSYQALKQHYLDSSNKLFSIVEDDLLEKVEANNNNNNNNKNKKNNNAMTGNYKLRSITNQKLNEIQLEVMQELTNYYTKCQQYYEEAFKNLADSLIPEQLY